MGKLALLTGGEYGRGLLLETDMSGSQQETAKGGARCHKEGGQPWQDTAGYRTRYECVPHAQHMNM